MLNNVHPQGEGDRHMNHSPLPPHSSHSHSHLAPQNPQRPISRSGSPFPEHMQQYLQQQPHYQPQLQRPPLPQGYSSSNASNQGQGQGQGQRSQSPFNPPLQQMQVSDTRTQLFVSNLPFRVRWQDLKDLMRKCGTVLRADVALSPTDGRSRGFGVVLFARAEDAAKAIGVYHGYTWQTRLLDVRIDTQDPTGALALAEANRQQALQQQREVYQNLASRMSPVPPHPPLPPPTQPLQHYTTNGGIQPQSSPYLGATHLSPPQSSAAPLVGTHSSPLLNPSLPPSQSHSTSHSPTDSSRPSPYLNPTLPRSNSSESNSSPQNGTAQSPPPPSSSSAYQPPPAPPPLSLDSRSQSPHHPQSYPHPLPRSNDSHSHHPPPQLQPSRSQPHFPSSQHQQQQIPPPPPPPHPPLLHSQSQIHSSQIPQNQNQQIMVPLSLLQSMSSQLQQQQGGGGGGGGGGFQVPGGLMSYYQAQSGGGAMGIGGGERGRMGGPVGVGNGGIGGGMMGGQGQGMNGMVPAQYTNRHLFIGNLPFNCQWQELKDLMRGAGSVLRADIAQGPDGRSRGFGSVLFSTPIDAERAVQLFNGYEFQGRTLKVHFDKFSGAGINQPSPLSNHPSEQNRNGGGGGGYRQDGPPMPQYPHQHQQPNAQIGRDSARGPPNYASSDQQRQQQEYMAQQQQRQQQSQQQGGGGGQFAYSPFQGPGEALQRDSSSRPGTAQAPIGSPSPSLQARQPPSMSGENGSTSPSSSLDPTAGSSSATSSGTQPTSSSTSPSLLRQNAAAPSRIAMPPPLPFGNGNNGPFSPMRANLPPMTPSMPAFTFGGFSAQTPPIHPHALFSPGIGPFSPQIGSPFFGPGQGMGHFQNVAPGAPSPGFGFNPMFPAFPPTPNGHPMQQQLQLQQQQLQQQQESMYPINGGDHPTPQAAPSNSVEASYFPPVPSSTDLEKVHPPSSEASTPDATLPNDGRPHSSSSTRNSRPYLMASASQPLESVSAPSLSPELSMDGSERPRLPQHSVSDNLAIDLARQLKLQEQGRNSNSNPRISAGGVIAQPGWAEESDSDYEEEDRGVKESEEEVQEDKLRLAMEKTERRKSFVPPSAVVTESSSSTPGGGGSGGSPGKLGVGDQGGSQGVRRASFEDASRKRPAFGSSIWG